MKRSIFISLLAICVFLPLFSQVLFDFDLNITTKVKDGNVVGDVQIVLTTGETPVKYIIINGGRITDEILVESKFTKKADYKFKDIPAGKYLIKIEDKQGRMAGKAFEISR
ncbi:MAG: hypothetical protein JXB34_11355 [Bacteroidales bacterium]|nr:hypothetical protein [Bacteroidales bacterium]